MQAISFVSLGGIVAIERREDGGAWVELRLPGDVQGETIRAGLLSLTPQQVQDLVAFLLTPYWRVTG